jgi:hypothetical protein
MVEHAARHDSDDAVEVKSFAVALWNQHRLALEAELALNLRLDELDKIETVA